MIRVMLCLKDVKAQMFLTPFFAPTVGVAYRSLMDEMQRGGSENTLASHPEDFEIYQMGSFDDETGFLRWNDGAGNDDWKPRLLCKVGQLVEKA